jgi:biopolymer transport protein ExbB
MSLPDIDTWVRALTLLPIVVCSVIGSALTLAKWVQLRRAQIAGDHLLLQVRPLVGAREYASALAVARRDRSHAARLIERAVALAGSPHERLAAQVEQAGRQLAREVDYGLGGVGLIATLGPLLGLFGTVVGIVLVFERLAGAQGIVSPHQLAGGIGTALYTTVAGLIVGMCALVSHRVLLALADGAIAQLETIGQELVDLIEGRAS